MVFLKSTVCSILFAAMYLSMEALAEETAANEVAGNQTDDVIWCFQCNSAKNKDCWDLKPTDTSSLYYKRCPQYEDEIDNTTTRKYFCRKITQTVINPDDEEKRVIRKCGWVKQEKSCYKVTNPAHKEIVCACDTNGCNAAPTQLTISYNLFALCIAVAVSVKLFR